MAKNDLARRLQSGRRRIAVTGRENMSLIATVDSYCKGCRHLCGPEENKC